MSCRYFNDFIRSVHEEIGEQAGYSYEYLAYWFADNTNLGKLNSLIGTCYSATYSTGQYGELVSYAINPEISFEELSIYVKIFELDLYNKQIRNINQGNASYAASNWISLKEGNSSISKINKKDITKSYKLMVKNTKKELDGLVSSYLKFRATPQLVLNDYDALYVKNDYIAHTATTETPTPTPTATEIPTPTPTATEIPTPTPTATEIPTPTPTNTQEIIYLIDGTELRTMNGDLIFKINN